MALALVAACESTSGDPIAIRDAWVRATPPGVETGAAYLSIATQGAADSLIGATSDVSRAVEIHTHVEENGVMRMTRVMELPITRAAPLALEPGGHHLMLVGLERALAPGDTVELTLEFAAAGEHTISVPVRDARVTGSGEHVQ